MLCPHRAASDPTHLPVQVGFRPVSSGHQGFCNSRERWLTLHSLFLAVWCEGLLMSVELHQTPQWSWYQTRYNRAGKYLDISNVDKVNNVTASRVQSRTGLLDLPHLALLFPSCFCYFVIFLDVITIKFISQLLKPKHIPLSWDKEYHAYMVSFEMGHCAQRAYQVPIRRVSWRLGDWKHWLQPISFIFYLLIHFVQTLWTFGAFSSKYVKCSFREDLQKPKIIS